MSRRPARHMVQGLLAAFALLAAAGPASAELVLKLLVVNPSETEVKEFEIKSPLPPEVKPEHVLDADGLKVDYDSQGGNFILVGKVTLKPKESITKRVLLEDVWLIAPERLSAIRREINDVFQKIEDTPYGDRGRVLGQSIERRLVEIEESQEQAFLSPVQHINRYRDNLKKLEQIEVDLVSMRQLMVMAALNPQAPTAAPLLPAGGEPGGEPGQPGGGLPLATAWKIIFMILGVLGFISLSFFLIWQRQVRAQVAKQSAAKPEPPAGQGGNGRPASSTTSEARPGQT